MEKIGSQAIKYAIGGLVSFAIESAGLFLLYDKLGLSLSPSVVISFVCAFATNFLLNQRWAFATTSARTRPQLLKFSLLVGINLIFTTIAMEILVGAGVHYLLAKILITSLLIVSNFLLLRIWVFRSTDDQSAPLDP